MFWIYGGGLSFGWSGQPAYDGATLAASQDVVVVSLGYRMNGTLKRIHSRDHECSNIDQFLGSQTLPRYHLESKTLAS